ncbi:MAG: DUF302 domain-containing protein [Steroidobacteraceae bacterium]
MGEETAIEGFRTVPAHRTVIDAAMGIEALARARGLTVFARIDFSGDASRAGLTLQPMQLVIFGNPKAGTPLLAAAPTVGIDLPLKVLIWEDTEGRTWFGYNDAGYLQRRHHFPAELIKNIIALGALVEAAAAATGGA